MTYKEAVDYLFSSAPMFQKIGSKAYKSGLENTLLLDQYFNHPHTNFKTIHIGGTNGKGSCSHTLAAILQCAGYKVGLYTSPHLVDFRERIRVNGTPISEEFVIDFIQKHSTFFEPLHPSFFELTTALAFHYFSTQEVDIAIIEVGLGGRLDCTNIISPLLSIITNISLDHIQFLGDSREKIAGEKAGIIKKETPIIIGEVDDEIKAVFQKKSKQLNAPICYANEQKLLTSASREDGAWLYQSIPYKDLKGELGGYCQQKNTNTILHALKVLQRLGVTFKEKDVRDGFNKVIELTGLRGRWEILAKNPKIICDTGHNVAGVTEIVEQLKTEKYNTLHIVFGAVNDKDIKGVLSLLPPNAVYYFTQAQIERALPVDTLLVLAHESGLKGTLYSTVHAAVSAALKNSLPEDLIFIGGSTFIVADLLSSSNALNLNKGSLR